MKYENNNKISRKYKIILRKMLYIYYSLSLLKFHNKKFFWMDKY